MGQKFYDESDIQNIANAIRSKNGTQNTYTVAQMAGAVGNIPTGITPSGSVTLTSNGTYDVTDKASAVVAVPAFSVTNQVPLSLNADGTPYNGGLGYKTGYTLSATSGSPSTENARSERAVTGFIPAARNDIIRAVNMGNSSVYPYGIWIFDSDKNLLNAFQLTAPSSGSFAHSKTVGIILDGRSAANSDKVAYVRIVFDSSQAGNLIVTKNEKISPLEV